MARGGRRTYDEEPKAERRLSPTHEREAALSGPAGAVLQLQTLAGNTAVNAMIRSAVLQRDEGKGGAPADTKEKPKQSGAKVTVEGVGDFVALSVSLSDVRSANQISLTKETDDRLTPVLMRAAAEGRPFPRVTIDFGSAQIVMTDVLVSTFQPGGSDRGNTPIDSFSFNFKEIEWKHQPSGEGEAEGGY